MFQVIDEEVTQFKASEAGKDFWGLRMIWTSMRGLGTRSIIQDMDNCIATKLAWPHLVAGYDLVGPEDLGRPLKDLLPELFWVGSLLLSFSPPFTAHPLSPALPSLLFPSPSSSCFRSSLSDPSFLPVLHSPFQGMNADLARQFRSLVLWDGKGFVYSGTQRGKAW